MVTLSFSGDNGDSAEVHLGRMLQILREFSTDTIVITYVIDDVWEYMPAMKVRLYNLLNNGCHLGGLNQAGSDPKPSKGQALT